MKTVTPRSLAYVAVQVGIASPPVIELKLLQLRFALSNANAWNENDGCFNYINFYNNIVDYFEIPVGPESQAHVSSLLSWWTRCASSFLVVVSDNDTGHWI
jgi:hypothetical protein